MPSRVLVATFFALCQHGAGDVGEECEEDEGALPHNRGLAAEEVFEQEAVGMRDFAIVEHDGAVCEDGTQGGKPAQWVEKPA